MQVAIHARTSRLGLRSTPEQEHILRQAAAASHKSLTEFVLDAACKAAEQTLLDQRLFVLPSNQSQMFLDLLDRPESSNGGLDDLFAHTAPWQH
ncbi:hypothetical protein AGMMS50229_11020 [Campylobacterota bacterium]|nr:hypothetical protein AGMMS50229_11020 [Campylobacterota bacterium]